MRRQRGAVRLAEGRPALRRLSRGFDPDRLLAALSLRELRALGRAADDVVACYGDLADRRANILDDILDGKPIAIRRRYPARSVIDPRTGGQFYYHVHGGLANEHGHFHVFQRSEGMPASVVPIVPPRRLRRTQGRGDAHLVAISMDRRGVPIGVFTTPWLFYPAPAVCSMLDGFAVDAATRPRLVDRWLTAVLRLFRLHIDDVVRRRDRALDAWRRRHPGLDPAHAIQIVTRRRISLDAQILAVRGALARRARRRRA